MKSTLKFIAWLAIMLGGLFVLFYISAQTNSARAGAGYGTGVLSYRFVASFKSYGDPESDDIHFYLITVVAEETFRFMLWGNVSPEYSKADLTWDIFSDAKESNEGEAVIDLQRMSLQEAGKSTPLDPDSLSSLLGLTPASSRDEIIAKSLFEFLQSARNGTIPRPSHHGISLPEPLLGRMQHFATGLAFEFLELAWILGWSCAGILAIFRNRKKHHTSAENHP